MEVASAAVFTLGHILGVGTNEEVPGGAWFCADAERVITQMRDKVPGDFLWPVDDFCCGAVRSEHPLCPVLGLCPESSVPVIANGANPYPTCGRVRAFDDFFPEAFFFSLVHNSSPSRVSVGKLPGGNFYGVVPFSRCH